MDKSIQDAIDWIQLIFPQKTLAELNEKYGLDKPVIKSIKDDWFVFDFGNGKKFSNPMGRIWNAIKDIAQGDTTEEYLKNIESLRKKYDFPIEYAGYYEDPETGDVKPYKTGQGVVLTGKGN
jgi:hypothetical protein